MTERTDIPAPCADDLLSRFPWFDLPLLERCSDGRELPARLAILSRYRPAIVRPAECCPKTADEHTPEEISGLEAGGLPSDDLLTEELAAIYLAQGLTGPAVEIYRRLSLLNPEKSVYFAEIIDKALSAESAGRK